MIEMFKMIHDMDKVNLEKLFYIDENERTSKYNSCLKIRRHVSSNIEFKIFTIRVINYWKKFTDEVVSCKSLSRFKRKLDEFMTAKGEI